MRNDNCLVLQSGGVREEGYHYALHLKCMALEAAVCVI